MFDEINTVEELSKIITKRIVDRVKANPVEYAKSLRDDGVIDDLQYKNMIINIRKTEAENDFEDKENE